MARLLLLEDDFRLAQQLEELLLRDGHLISIALTLDNAMGLCKHYEFDLIVSDLFLTERGSVTHQGGFSFILRLRDPHAGEDAPPWWKFVPILAISGGVEGASKGVETAEGALWRAAESGADALLAKGFSDEEFLTTLNALLKNGRPLDAIG
ncbi:MAG: hypothetical protein AAF648_13695 [Pseudomonadota bacterium]